MLRPRSGGRGYAMSMDSRFLLAPEAPAYTPTQVLIMGSSGMLCAGAVPPCPAG